MLSAAALVMGIVWIIGVVDAYRLGIIEEKPDEIDVIGG